MKLFWLPIHIMTSKQLKKKTEAADKRAFDYAHANMRLEDIIRRIPDKAKKKAGMSRPIVRKRRSAKKRGKK